MSRLFFPRPSTVFRPFSAESLRPGAIVRLKNRPLPALGKRIRMSRIKRILNQPWVWGGGLWLCLLVWDWPLAVAIAVGSVGAIAVYLYQLRRLHVNWFDALSQSDSILSNQAQWQAKVQQVSERWRPQLTNLWSKCWEPGNRPLTLSLLVGSILASIVATMALIYRDLHSFSLVLAMGLQLGLVVVFGWGLWWQSHMNAEGISDHESSSVGTIQTVDAVQTIDQLWVDLTSPDPAVRLIAIYRAVNWVQTPENQSDPALSRAMDATKLATCFRVMVTHESNPSVQQALRDGLMSLQG